MTGGSSFVSAVRALFSEKFGSQIPIRAGQEFTSVAEGLALYGLELKLTGRVLHILSLLTLTITVYSAKSGNSPRIGLSLIFSIGILDLHRCWVFN